MSKFYSPLRYPGGKTKIYNNILQIIKDNDLYNGVYIEPYAGGAGLAMKLLLKKDMSEIYINDFDISIYAFWKSILDNTDEFCTLINNTPVNMDEWHKQKEIQDNKYSVDLFTLGFSTFFLNRTNRSGIIKGGVIGGHRQTGKYKLNCRYSKEGLIKRIELIAAHKEKIHIYNLDAIEFIENIKDNLPDNSLFYLDPPYYSKGPELYTNFYNHNDHLELSKYMSKNDNYKWLITYDNNEEIKVMYNEHNQINYTLNYSAQNRCKGTEIMIYNNLKINVAAI